MYYLNPNSTWEVFPTKITEAFFFCWSKKEEYLTVKSTRRILAAWKKKNAAWQEDGEE